MLRAQHVAQESLFVKVTLVKTKVKDEGSWDKGKRRANGRELTYKSSDKREQM